MWTIFYLQVILLKMLAVNFYASCSVSRGNSIGKEPIKIRLGKSRLRAAIYAS